MMKFICWIFGHKPRFFVLFEREIPLEQRFECKRCNENLGLNPDMPTCRPFWKRKEKAMEEDIGIMKAAIRGFHYHAVQGMKK